VLKYCDRDETLRPLDTTCDGLSSDSEEERNAKQCTEEGGRGVVLCRMGVRKLEVRRNSESGFAQYIRKMKIGTAY
jgi:hypothetical protein